MSENFDGYEEDYEPVPPKRPEFAPGDRVRVRSGRDHPDGHSDHGNARGLVVGWRDDRVRVRLDGYQHVKGDHAHEFKPAELVKL